MLMTASASSHCAEWLFNLLFLESDLITAGGKGCGFAVGISLSSPMPQVSSFFLLDQVCGLFQCLGLGSTLSDSRGSTPACWTFKCLFWLSLKSNREFPTTSVCWVEWFWGLWCGPPSIFASSGELRHMLPIHLYSSCCSSFYIHFLPLVFPPVTTYCKHQPFINASALFAHFTFHISGCVLDPNGSTISESEPLRAILSKRAVRIWNS